MRRLWLFVGIGLIPLSAFAQTPVAGTERLFFTHDGVNTSRYELQVDTGPRAIVTPVTVGTEKAVALPAMTPGTHSLVIWACNDVNQCAASDPLAVIVRVAPVKATGLRIN